MIKNKFDQLFPNLKKDKVVIGAIHFPPLLGYKDCPGLGMALKNALKDLDAFEKGGVDGVIFENNYDIPHTEYVTSEVVAAMTYLGEKIKSKTSLPVGINVLWNDYRTAFSIAKVLDLQFIRLPVFVDKVETDFGVITGDIDMVRNYREKIGAENIFLFADIHVKHSKILSQYSIVESAKLAIKSGADAVIVTGKWTGDSPDIEELKEVRSAVYDFPILVGSGADKDNISLLLKYADGAIVSTSLKHGVEKDRERNVKAYHQRVDKSKVFILTSHLDR